MRTVAVVTGGRADYGHLLPIMRQLQRHPKLALSVIATGMHLAPEYGRTADGIERDGFNISHRVEALLASDTPQGTSKAIGLGILGFSQVFSADRPDILLLLGDRFEIWAAAIAATPFCIPIAHVHGGESTMGAMDEAIRHGVTKLSHLHFVATDEYARRVVQLGEEPWRITVCGAPGLDNLRSVALLDPAELNRRLGFKVTADSLLVTFHPVTLDGRGTQRRMSNLLKALEMLNRPVIFTAPNADAGGREMYEMVRAFVAEHDDAYLVVNAGTDLYFGLMRAASAMVGNSSSGIIEAASFALPVVDIGDRQAGRVRPDNVIHCEEDAASIVDAVRRATDPAFRTQLAGMQNPYGDGLAAQRIVSRLAGDLPPADKLIQKRFYDLPAVQCGDEPTPGQPAEPWPRS